MRSPLAGCLLILLLAFFSAPEARASSFYIDAAPGVAELSPSPDGMGGGFDFDFFHAFSEAPLQFQLGLEGKLTSGSAGGQSYETIGFYPAARIQLNMLFAGFGYAPLLYGSSGPASGASGILLEGGVLWPVVPIFSLGASASMQSFSNGGTAVPTGATSFSVIMRFYFWFSEKSHESSGEFRGWRYPFGREMRD